MSELTEAQILALAITYLDIVGADIVCYCPPLDDQAQTTALIIGETMQGLPDQAGNIAWSRSISHRVDMVPIA